MDAQRALFADVNGDQVLDLITIGAAGSRLLLGSLAGPFRLAAGFDAFIDANVATARRAKAAGVTIVMGSDAVFTGFGDNTRELDVFVERVGMTPMEALATATTDAARALGIDDRLGAIRPGYEADFVVIDGDLASIEDIHRVVSVVKRGAVIDVAAPAGGSGMLNPLVSP